MNPTRSRAIDWLRALLAIQQPEPVHRAEKIVSMQLHIVLPAKAGVILVAVYYLFTLAAGEDVETPYSVAVEFVKGYFIAYLIFNLLATGVFYFWKRFPAATFQWLVFTLGLLDGIFISGLVFITGGFESIVFWILPGMAVLNAISIPLASPQLVLNILLSVFYFSSGVLENQLPPTTLMVDSRASSVRPGNRGTRAALPPMSTNTFTRTNSWITVADLPYVAAIDDEEQSPEPIFLKIFVLWLVTACCYGTQVLAERQRRVAEESRESAVRQAQLHSAGRLAAEFAHQIKNPLAIINNATYSMRKALNAGRTDLMRQIEIIQEEVERSDRIITQLMGYAQLNEGRVEKLDVAEELDTAIDQVFPPGEESGIVVSRLYVRTFPPLLMQRRHLRDALVNLLQNAREALQGKGEIAVSAVCRTDSSMEIAIRDSGPGIPRDKVERIFEAYYTTKEKGSGLGLAIVKHNVELYAGRVKLESELGKGSRFILTFPAKTVISAAKVG